MKNEVSREPRFFTAPEWVDKREVLLSTWPINRKANHVGRVQAGGINRAKALIRRLTEEGTL